MTVDWRFLRQVPCLRTLDEAALTRLADLCRSAVVDPGTLLMQKGEADRSVVFLLSGRARVAIYTSQGRLVHLEDALPGAVLGEIAAISGTPRAAMVETIETALTARLPGDAFVDLLRREPEVALALLRQAHGRLHRLTERFYESAALNVQGRLHAELLRLCGPIEPGSSTAMIRPTPTQEDLASRIGTRRESVTRELSRLAKLGILARRGRQLEIRDLGVLRALAAGAEEH